MKIERREFLKMGAIGVLGAGTMMLLPRTYAQQADIDPSKAKNKLVVVQLSGGNDGLNTVVPYGDPAYYTKRPTLAVKPENVLKIDDRVGFAPQLAEMKQVYDQGRLAVLQAAGYPTSNRSHFFSMDVWHTADLTAQDRFGWLGKFIDGLQTPEKDPLVGLSVGIMPKAMKASTLSVPALESLDRYQWTPYGNDPIETSRQIRAFSDMYSETKDSTTLMDILQNIGKDALVSSTDLKNASRSYLPSVNYPLNSILSINLKLIAQLIGSGLGTRIYYLNIGGFDTHASQVQQHQNLLTTISQSLGAFHEDLKDQDNGDRVMTMLFSEFGRRAAQNGSNGTDHGKGGPMFVLGGGVKGGMYGPEPNLNDLNDGDVNPAIDFRHVYATILEKWMGANSQKVMGQRFPLLDFVK
ncbi:MAG TPA: DUF1501 domain-containing protein [Nitrososphaerales archaeon]